MVVLQRGHPLLMADTVFAQGELKRACPHGTKAVVFKAGYDHKQLRITKVVSAKEMLYYIAIYNFTADNAIAPAKWSFKIQSCIFRFCIFRNIGPANSVPAFSGPPFSALPQSVDLIMALRPALQHRRSIIAGELAIIYTPSMGIVFLFLFSDAFLPQRPRNDFGEGGGADC